MARLTAPNGARVDVSDSKVGALLGMGFTKPAEESKSAPKKAPSRKSSK